MCVDPNDQINQRAKQKYEVLSATPVFIFDIQFEKVLGIIEFVYDILHCGSLMMTLYDNSVQILGIYAQTFANIH